MAEQLRVPFRLRELDGSVSVEIAANEDPRRWGYPLLGLDYPPEKALGFPVCRASVAYLGEGYGAFMAWIQIVRYHAGDGEETVLVDTAPQLSGSGMPYYAWGTNPSFFDAPSTTQGGTVWMADAFLTASPDALMTRAIEPLCGFSWGYTTPGERPNLLPPVPVEPAAWSSARSVLTTRYPSWNFGPSRADPH